MYSFLIDSVTTMLSQNLTVAKSNSASLCFRIAVWLVQEKQERLRANGTYQVLPYVHRISLLGKKKKKN